MAKTLVATFQIEFEVEHFDSSHLEQIITFNRGLRLAVETAVREFGTQQGAPVSSISRGLYWKQEKVSETV
jgi:hypothetical protein